MCDEDLFGAKIYELLSTSDEHKFSSVPPTNPQGGEVYLYSYDAGDKKGELLKSGSPEFVSSCDYYFMLHCMHCSASTRCQACIGILL